MKETNSYGLLGTGLWFLLIAGIYLLIQSLVLGFYAGATQSLDAAPTQEQIEAAMLELQLNGNVIAWATILSGTICTALIFLAAKLKKTANVKNYLAFMMVDKSAFIKWGLIFIGVLLLSEGVTYLLGKNSFPGEIISIYQSASPKWVLWLAIVLIAPIFEELFFRGFIFEGLSRSFLGVIGSIVITAAVWALIHIQYEVYYISMIFIWGLILG